MHLKHVLDSCLLVADTVTLLKTRCLQGASSAGYLTYAHLTVVQMQLSAFACMNCPVVPFDLLRMTVRSSEVRTAHEGQIIHLQQ